jgi:hypothetical protein
MPTTRICVVVDVPADRLWERLSEYGTWGSWLTQFSESNIEWQRSQNGDSLLDAIVAPPGSFR